MSFSRLNFFRRCKGSYMLRRLTSKVPEKPVWIDVNVENLPEVPDLTPDVIDHLERLSLVEFNNQDGVERLKKVIESAHKLFVIDTKNVEPMDSVLENRVLHLRQDEVTEVNQQSETLSNASKTLEGFFVAPQGNIPLKKKERDYKKNFEKKGESHY